MDTNQVFWPVFWIIKLKCLPKDCEKITKW
jgi:hypothetical protein